MKKTVFFIVALVLTFSAVSAQKIKVVEGNLSALKGSNGFYVSFDYSDMGVGKYEKEADYVEYKSNEWEEKGEGTAAEWKAKWEGDRETRYQPKFIELINKYIGDIAEASQEKGDQKWEIKVHTTFTEPGYNVYMSRRPALINVTITISEIANPDNKVVVTMEKVPGQGATGYDFDAAYRIQESYAKCGKELGALLKKKAL